jgi:hypothetical protein
MYYHLNYKLHKPNGIKKGIISWSQYGQDQLIDKLLNQKRNGFFVEIGGYDGETFSNSPQHPMKYNLPVLKCSLMMIKGDILQQHFLWRFVMFHLLHTIWRPRLRSVDVRSIN